MALRPTSILITTLCWLVLSACGAKRTAEFGTEAPTETQIRVRNLQEEILAGPKEPLPDWALGPFERGEVNGQPMLFRPDLNWDDPAGIADWAPRAFWNPALLEEDGRLYLFYRTGPHLEGLHSRVGLAWSDDGGATWEDYEGNPILYPTLENEQLSVEDPRIYTYEGTYYLYYMAIQQREEGGVYADINLATSDDLRTWEKHGTVLPRSISQGWSKSAVIPRSPSGEAVMIDGEFLMYVSERSFASELDVEEQMIGRSTDLINWTFEQEPFLEPQGPIESIYEVASITTGFPGSSDMVGDVFFRRANGDWACGQFLLSQENPTQTLDFTDYGTCSWGGKIIYDGQWMYAQGWLEPESIALYTAPARPELLDSIAE